MIPTTVVEHDVLVCPACGYDMDGCFIVSSEEVARELGVPMNHGYCSRCHADLGTSEAMQSMFSKRPYPTVTCDKCGTAVAVAHWNTVVRSPGFEMVMCPRCFDDDARAQRLLGVRVRGDSSRLLTLEECCASPGAPDGVHLQSPTDLQAVLAMLTMAKREDLGFLTFVSDPYSRRLVCREGGEVVGYLAYTEHVPDSFPDPTIHQIYVRAAFRGRGHGTGLVGGFLNLFPEGRLCVETPIQHRAVHRIFHHYGLVTFVGEGHVQTTGRLYFRHGL